MADLISPLLFSGLFNGDIKYSKMEQILRPRCGPGGNFYFDLAEKFGHTRLAARTGEWSLPWRQSIISGSEMPDYEEGYSKSFSEVSDERAQEIRARIKQGEKFILMYSGGMDSTLVLVALLKNLNPEELSSVSICSTAHSINENPEFWRKYVHEKFETFDFAQYSYDDFIRGGHTPITADLGDCIFGTVAGLIFYHDFEFYLNELPTDRRGHLRSLKNKMESDFTLFEDLLIRYFALNQTTEGLRFGRIFYEKMLKNIRTSKVPVRSLHDFFWWFIFNIKYVECAGRAAIDWNQRLPIRECLDSMVNWFGSRPYQLWSMANNNNGTKIRDSVVTYKFALREYIYEFDKNEWYFHFKTKLGSLRNIPFADSDKLAIFRRLLKTRLKFLRNLPGINGDKFPLRKRLQHQIFFGLDSRYERLWLRDPRVYEYFQSSLTQYQVDWCDL